MNVIIYPDGNANAVALSHAETAGKYNLVLDMMFFNGFFKETHNFLGALEVA